MKDKNLYVRQTSHAKAAAITIMLSMTALAQDSPRLCTPRRAGRASTFAPRIFPNSEFLVDRLHLRLD